MTKLSVNIDSLERQRFARHLLDDNCDFYFHQDKRSIASRCKFKKAQQVFIWGRRPPDIEAFKLASKTAETIIILQHAKNPRRERVPFSYFSQNLKKVIYWLSSMGRLKFSNVKMRQPQQKPRVLLFYFTEAYKQEWQRHFSSLHDVEYIECAEPDVSQYGAKVDTKVSKKNIPCFYVDEPLTKTLGITEEEENALLHALQERIEDDIYVKLHPRSNPSKYIQLPRFRVVNKIYQNADVVAGYRSALLDFNFRNKQLVKLESDLTWRTKTVESRKLQYDDYISQIKEFLKINDI